MQNNNETSSLISELYEDPEKQKKRLQFHKAAVVVWSILTVLFAFAAFMDHIKGRPLNLRMFLLGMLLIYIMGGVLEGLAIKRASLRKAMEVSILIAVLLIFILMIFPPDWTMEIRVF